MDTSKFLNIRYFYKIRFNGVLMSEVIFITPVGSNYFETMGSIALYTIFIPFIFIKLRYFFLTAVSLSL